MHRTIGRRTPRLVLRCHLWCEAKSSATQRSVDRRVQSPSRARVEPWREGLRKRGSRRATVERPVFFARGPVSPHRARRPTCVNRLVPSEADVKRTPIFRLGSSRARGERREPADYLRGLSQPGGPPRSSTLLPTFQSDEFLEVQRSLLRVGIPSETVAAGPWCFLCGALPAPGRRIVATRSVFYLLPRHRTCWVALDLRLEASISLVPPFPRRASRAAHRGDFRLVSDWIRESIVSYVSHWIAAHRGPKVLEASTISRAAGPPLRLSPS